MANTWTMYEGKRITMTFDQVGVSDKAPKWAGQEWTITLRNGRKRMTFPYYGGGFASDPTADDVVGSLASDADALDMSFPQWCDEYGCDADSISDHRTFLACRKIGKRFRNLVA